MHRLAITGAQGTGKTTLARRVGEVVSSRGIQTAVLEGIGKRVAQTGLRLGKHATVETICAFAASHLRREREATAEVVVQDRCLLDLYAYCRVLEIGRHVTDFVSEAARLSLGLNVTVCCVPLAESLPPSTSAVEDLRFRKLIAAEIVEGANALGIQLHLVEGTVEERVRNIVRLLGIEES